MLYNNVIVNLNKISESNDEIIFSFGSNELILYRNPLGTTYYRNGDRDNLGIQINGFRKVLNKLKIDDKCVTMTFYNE